MAGQYVQKVAIDLIKEHIPSLTDEAEGVITARYLSADEAGLDYADAAYRVCACGKTIDGFYEYVDHLIAVFGGESHYGG